MKVRERGTRREGGVEGGWEGEREQWREGRGKEGWREGEMVLTLSLHAILYKHVAEMVQGLWVMSTLIKTAW